MDITVSKDEIIEYKKLKTLSEITLTKEKVALFERKYQCSLNDFKKRLEENEEEFEEWDDYIEWKAYSEQLIDLENK